MPDGIMLEFPATWHLRKKQWHARAVVIVSLSVSFSPLGECTLKIEISDNRGLAEMSARDEFYVRYYVGHKGKFG